MPESISARTVAAESSGLILTALRAAGLRPATFHCAAGRGAGGVSVGIDLRKAGEVPIDAAIDACRRSLDQSFPVNLCVSHIGARDTSQAELQRIVKSILRRIGGHHLRSGRFGISLHSVKRPLAACRLISPLLPRQVSRYLLLDGEPPQSHTVYADDEDEIWSFAWRLSGSHAPLRAVYAKEVRSACPLLADEPAQSVLPEGGIVVPAGTAWLPVELYLPDFSNGHGQLQWPRLEQSLALCVNLGNKLLDTLVWSDIQQKKDAECNRRLAVVTGGVGDLVAERDQAPGELACQQHLFRDVTRLRQCLWRHSVMLARRTKPVPALLNGDCYAPWHDLPHRRTWQQKWREALQASAVRNRNLLVMSPYSVLPRGDAATIDYADLLPVLKFADAWSFADAPPLGRWNTSDFSRFHRRARAIIGRQNATSFIADEV